MRTVFTFLALLIISAISLNSQIPQLLNWQGVLEDSNGDLLNGNYNLNFAIYNVSTGGTALFTETKSVTISDGLVNVNLGESTNLNLDFNQQYYLGITVDNGTELPRIKLTTAPYAFQALNAVNAENATNAVNATNATNATNADNATYAATAGAIGPNSVTSASIVNGQVLTVDIGAGAVTNTELGNNSVSTAKIQANAVTNTEIANNAVTSAKINNGDVDTPDLKADAVTSAKIKDGEVDTQDLKDDAVTSGKIKNGTIKNEDIGVEEISGERGSRGPGFDVIEFESIGGGDIAPNTIESSHIIDSQILREDINDEQLVFAINNLTDFVDLIAGDCIEIEIDDVFNEIIIKNTCTEGGGLIDGEPFEVKDGDGTVIFKVDNTGSYHYVKENFYEGVEVKDPLEEVAEKIAIAVGVNSEVVLSLFDEFGIKTVEMANMLLKMFNPDESEVEPTIELNGETGTITLDNIPNNLETDINGGGLWINDIDNSVNDVIIGKDRIDSEVNSLSGTTPAQPGLYIGDPASTGDRTIIGGGGIYNAGGKLTIDNTDFSKNTEISGGGIYIADGEVTIEKNHDEYQFSTTTKLTGEVVFLDNIPFGDSDEGSISIGQGDDPDADWIEVYIGNDNTVSITGDGGCAFDPPGDPFFAFLPEGDGTRDAGCHLEGLTTYAEKGIEIPLNNGNTMYLTPSEGFAVKDALGNYISHWNPSGASYHTGFESFVGGVSFSGNSCSASSVFSFNAGLNCSGDLDATDQTCTAGEYITDSDKRLKKKIKPLERALDKVISLEGVSYYLKSDDSERKIGFIAQDVKSVLPEVVIKNQNSDLYGISYGNITALLVEAMKEQNEIINDQEEKIEELESRVEIIENLERENQMMKAKFNEMEKMLKNLIDHNNNNQLKQANLN